MVENKRNIEFVVKFGGSITESGTQEQIQALCVALTESYAKKRNFLLVPGGGTFAEEVRGIQKQFRISDENAHWMAIFAMEQYALLLHHLLPESKIVEYSTAKFNKELQNISESKIPILSIQKYMKNESKLVHDWNATSDAIATEIALNLLIPKIVFLKDIDGLMIKNNLIDRITANDLEELSSSPLDSITPSLLKKSKITAYIVNGFQNQRVVDLLTMEKEIIGTKIVL